MSRLIRRVLRLLSLAIGVAFAAAVLFVALFDLASRREEIALALTDALGRAVAIDGAMRLDWGFTPVATLEGVRVANPDGAADGDFLVAEQVSLHLALLPLLAGQHVVVGVESRGVRLALARQDGGTANWQDLDLATLLPAVRQIDLRDTAISFDGSPAMVIGRLSLTGADSGRALEAIGNYEATPWQLQIQLSEPVDGGAEDMTVRLSFAGMRLSAAGAFGFDRDLPIADARARLVVDDAGVAARFLGLPQGLPAFTLEGGIVAGGTRVDLNDFTYRTDGGEARGDATLSLAQTRPVVAVDLTVTTLDIDALEASGLLATADIDLSVTAERIVWRSLTVLGRTVLLRWRDGVLERAPGQPGLLF